MDAKDFSQIGYPAVGTSSCTGLIRRLCGPILEIEQELCHL